MRCEGVVVDRVCHWKTHRPEYKAFIPLQSSGGITRYCNSSATAAIKQIFLREMKCDHLSIYIYNFCLQKCDK